MLAMTIAIGSGTAQATTSSETPEKQVNVKVVTTDNGTSETVDKILTLDNNASIESILREMGVIDEFGQIADNESVEIIVRRKRHDALLQDINVQLEPAPGPPVFRTPPVQTGSGFLGVNIADVRVLGDADKATSRVGVAIRSIIPNTGAADSDLRGGDVIVSIDGIPVASVDQMVKTIQALKPGSKVEIEFLRDDQKMTTVATLGSRAEYMQRQREQNIERMLHKHRSRRIEGGANPVLGLSLANEINQNPKVIAVMPGSTADKMGFQPNDKVVSVGGVDASNWIAMDVALRENLKLGEPLNVVVDRNGQQVELSGTVEIAPMSAGRIQTADRIQIATPFLGVGHSTGVEGSPQVTYVIPNTTAEEMGIQAGDKIVGINGKKIAHPMALQIALRTDVKIGEPIAVDIERNGEVLNFSGTAKAREAKIGSSQMNGRWLQLPAADLEEAQRNMELAQQSLENAAGQMEQYAAFWENDSDIVFPDAPHFDPQLFADHMANFSLAPMDQPEVIREVRVSISVLDLGQDDINTLSRQIGGDLSNDLEVQDLTLYPNPSDGRFNLNFELPGDGVSVVKIFDVAGNEIYAETLNGVDGNYERMIDISDKPTGAYFLQVTRNGQSYTKKLVID